MVGSLLASGAVSEGFAELVLLYSSTLHGVVSSSVQVLLAFLDQTNSVRVISFTECLPQKA